MNNAAKKLKKAQLSDNPVWDIINEPDFVQRCHSGDVELVERLNSLTSLPREQLGKLVRDALHHTTDHRVGRIIKALSHAMTHEANGAIAFAIFEQCELPKEGPSG